MDNEARILLDDAIACCQRDGLDARLVNMLASARACDLTDDALTIEAPSRFAYSYLVKQREVIERYLEEIAFAPLALTITVPQAPPARKPVYLGRDPLLGTYRRSGEGDYRCTPAEVQAMLRAARGAR